MTNRLLDLPQFPDMPWNRWEERGWTIEPSPKYDGTGSDTCNEDFSHSKALLTTKVNGVEIYAVVEWAGGKEHILYPNSRSEAGRIYMSIDITTNRIDA